jgi:nitroimidazol reductase NimA-like FMN-containing flavoprotein (pyridoxamine 5'-phosphate oxidase superfamily)
VLETMKALIRAKDLCVLATASDNRPHCSLMAYASNEDCREIYMVTHRASTKYRNLMQNPSASLLIDTREEDSPERRSTARALTVNGTFQRVEDEAKRMAIREKLLERHPLLRSLADLPDAELLCVKVETLLLLDGIADAHFERMG